MKKLVAFLLIMCFVMNMPFQIEGKELKEFSIKFGEIKIANNGNWIEIDTGCNDILMHTGYPMLPYKTKVLTFPFGTKIESIKVKTGEVKIIKLDKKIHPAPNPVPLNMENAKVEIKEGRIYESNEAYPSDWITWNMGAGIENGVHVVFLSIHAFPARYIPAKNELLYTNEIKIKVKYEPPEKPLLQNDVYDLLIIAPSEFLDELQPLVEHKNSWGIPTFLTSLTSARTYPGRDDAEKVKYSIKEAIEQWGIKYVLLVGSAEKMPVRYAYIDDGTETHHVTDLYYADIYDANGKFSSWDTNDNDVFGEYEYNGKTDEIDFYPDVYVGRLACESETDVTTVVNKIINYENTAAEGEWFRRAILCGGDSHEDNGKIYEGEYTKNKVKTYLDDFEITKLYASLGNVDASNIRREINKGAGFVDFSGHGNRLSWATHPPENFNKWIGIDVSDVSLLSNGEMLPIVVIDACSTGEFDKGTCLAWHFVKVKNKGSVATFATTALSWGYTGSYCISGLSGYMDVRLAYHLSDGRAGEMLANSINDYISRHTMEKLDYKTIEEWILFGDPSLKIGGYEGTSIGLSKPKPGYLYLFNQEIKQTFLGNTIILGSIDVEVSATEGIVAVEFYIDDELKYTDYEEPFSWQWDERVFWRHNIKVIGYGEGNEVIERSMDVIIFHL